MENRKKTSRIWKISSEDFKNVVAHSNSYSDIARYFNYSLNSAIFNMIKKRMTMENISLYVIENAQKKQRIEMLKKLHNSKKTPLKDILVENSSYNRSHLKARLIKEGLLEEKCYKCGLGSEWQGEQLTLQLDHKNGINNDNRLENLWLLCPNCHSQTPTFNGKNKYVVKKCTDCGKTIGKKHTRCIPCANKVPSKSISQRKVERPSRIELIELILNKPFVQIGSEYGVSDNAIRKWCRAEGLPTRKSDIKLQRESFEKEIADVKSTV